jgi:hypothetical protein
MGSSDVAQSQRQGPTTVGTRPVVTDWLRGWSKMVIEVAGDPPISPAQADLERVGLHALSNRALLSKA